MLPNATPLQDAEHEYAAELSHPECFQRRPGASAHRVPRELEDAERAVKDRGPATMADAIRAGFAVKHVSV